MSQISFTSLSENRYAYWVLYGIGAILILFSAVWWWTKVSVDPYPVFWGAIRNSMATSGVTIHLDSVANGTNDNQAIQYSLGVSNQVHVIHTVTQGKAIVKTESIGDTMHTYTRYTSIDTGSKSSKVPANVINVWANPLAGQTTQLLPQVALGIALPMGAVPVPIGYIGANDRATLLHDMQSRGLYNVSYHAVKKEHRNGRLVYDYNVSMQPGLYLGIMKIFAHDVGLNDLSNIDESQYSQSGNLSLTFSIDARSQQVIEVKSDSIGIDERYDGYGIPVKVTMPSSAISLTELQKRLSSLSLQ